MDTRNTALGSDIRIEAERRPVVIRRHDAVIAATRRALLVYGGGPVPIYYVPMEDVYMEHLVDAPAGAEGEASERRYFSVTASGGGPEHAAWLLIDPHAEHPRLTNFVGFDPDPFNITVG